MCRKIFFILALAVLLPHTATAANNNLTGLTVSPFIIELDVAKGGSVDSEVTVTNNSGRDLYLVGTARDFLAGQDGQPMFVPDTVENDKTFSLASWIKFKDENKFAIKAGEEKVIHFSVNPPRDAEDGTHYGAVLFDYVSGEDVGGSVIKQSVGTIALVRYGWGRERGSVKLSSIKKIFWKPQPIPLTLNFRNEGNVHVKPKGEVYIKDVFGRVVATPFVNRDGANVLPFSTREFDTVWTPSKLAFGFYRAEAIINYGNTRLEERTKMIIWVMPWYTTGAVVLILIGIIYFWLHGHHVYKRRVIRKHIEKQL